MTEHKHCTCCYCRPVLVGAVLANPDENLTGVNHAIASVRVLALVTDAQFGDRFIVFRKTYGPRRIHGRHLKPAVVARSIFDRRFAGWQHKEKA